MDGLPTIETARRLLRSHGIDDAKLAEAAKQHQRQWEQAQEAPRDWPTVLAAWEAEHPQPEFDDDADPETVLQGIEGHVAALDEAKRAWQREVWLAGSVKQLQRHWGGRCISCAQWTQPTSPERDDHGVCRAILADSTDGLVRLANSDRKLIATVAQFGCICWGEIPADDAETLRARAELAMALGMLPRMPEGA